jgi:hypothetical protein
MDTNPILEILPLVAPLVLIQLALLAVGYIDLAKPERRTRGPKWAWALILLISFIGPVIYFLAGREET